MAAGFGATGRTCSGENVTLGPKTADPAAIRAVAAGREGHVEMDISKPSVEKSRSIERVRRPGEERGALIAASVFARLLQHRLNRISRSAWRQFGLVEDQFRDVADQVN